MIQLVDRVDWLKDKWSHLHDQLQKLSNACNDADQEATRQRIVAEAETEILNLIELCEDMFLDAREHHTRHQP